MSDGIRISVEDSGQTKIERVQKLLAGIPGGAGKAIGSALKRAATSGEAYAAKVIAQEYVIGAGDFKKYTTSTKTVSSDSGGTTVNINFRGNHIALLKFDTSVGRDGRVTARVKRGNAKTALDHVFEANVGSHTGLFERTGASRFPVEQKMGPSTPQMMSANDEVKQDISDKVQEVFDERIDHEMLRVLNGW